MQSPKRPFRIWSMEGALGAFGLYSLISGLLYGQILSVFWGATILCGLVILYFVRRRDWSRHWEEMEAEKRRRV